MTDTWRVKRCILIIITRGFLTFMRYTNPRTHSLTHSVQQFLQCRRSSATDRHTHRPHYLTTSVATARIPRYTLRRCDMQAERSSCSSIRYDKKGKGSPYSITERRVPELNPVLGSQPANDVSHKPGGRLPLLSDRPVVTLATLKRAVTSFAAW